MFSKPTRNWEAPFWINENRHAIKYKLNYEISKDTKMDFRYMKTNHTHISKRALTEKKPTLATESLENKKRRSI